MARLYVWAVHIDRVAGQSLHIAIFSWAPRGQICFPVSQSQLHGVSPRLVSAGKEKHWISSSARKASNGRAQKIKSHGYHGVTKAVCSSYFIQWRVFVLLSLREEKGVLELQSMVSSICGSKRGPTGVLCLQEKHSKKGLLK